MQHRYRYISVSTTVTVTVIIQVTFVTLTVMIQRRKGNPHPYYKNEIITLRIKYFKLLRKVDETLMIFFKFLERERDYA